MREHIVLLRYFANGEVIESLDLILHVVQLPRIEYMINLLMAWKKAETCSCS